MNRKYYAPRFVSNFALKFFLIKIQIPDSGEAK